MNGLVVLPFIFSEKSGIQWYVADRPHLRKVWFRLCFSWIGKTGENGQSFKCGKQNPVGIRPSVQQGRIYLVGSLSTGSPVGSSDVDFLMSLMYSQAMASTVHRASHACVIRREWKVLPGKHKKDRGEKRFLSIDGSCKMISVLFLERHPAQAAPQSYTFSLNY